MFGAFVLSDDPNGKLFGVWGLLLGIPVMNYVFRHAIRA